MIILANARRLLLVQFVCALAISLTTAPAHAYDWLQFGGDAQHSGRNTAETAITPNNVSTLTQKYQVTLPATADGAPVFLEGVSTPIGTKDLLFVTTRDGRIIALDAQTGAQVWTRQYGPGTCQINLTGGACYTTSSPAIDPNRQYVYSYGLDGNVHQYQVGDGTETFDATWPQPTTLKGFDEKGSSALAIATSNGTTYLYVVHGGYPGDNGDYQGHVTAINLETGAQKIFNAACSDQTVHFRRLADQVPPTCSTPRNAIWSRPGVIYDAGTDLIFMGTGNGLYDGNRNWSESIIALRPDGSGGTGINAGKPLDSYTPANFQTLDNGDADVGSTAPAILPVPVTSSVQHLAVQSGKDAKLRLINLANLSGQGGPGHVGGEVGTVINVPQGGVVLTQPGVWVNPVDGTTWVYVVNSNGASGLQLIFDVNGNPSLAPRWQNVEGGTSPIIANNLVFFISGSTVRALDPVSGNVSWSLARTGGFHWESLIVANGVVYATDGSNGLTAFAIAPASTTTTLTSSANPSTAGASVTFTATVTGNAPTGTVAFAADNTPISSCGTVGFTGGTANARTAVCSISTLSAGVHSIVATYSGDRGNTGSSSAALSQVVNSVAPPGSLVNPSFEIPALGSGYQYNPSTAGIGWTFSANSGVQANGSAWGAAAAPDGNQTAFVQGTASIAQTLSLSAGGYTLSFQAARRSCCVSPFVQPIQVSVDGIPVGSAVSPASTSFSSVSIPISIATTGAHTITFSGTDPSDKTTFIDLVTPASSNLAATTTTLVSSPNPSTVGATVAFTATVNGSAPSGTVAFTADSTPISGCSAVGFSGGTVNAPTATCSTSGLPQGTHSVVATYSGDSGNGGSTSTALSQVVNAGSPPAALINPSFEIPALGSGYQYNPSTAGIGWAFSANSGVQGNGSAWGAPAAPDGSQTAFIQATGSISQTLSLSAGGYTLSFQAARRACCVSPFVQPIQVSVDGISVGGLVSPASTSFSSVSIPISISTTGAHTITFTGTDSSDKTTFIDIVTLASSNLAATSTTLVSLPNPSTVGSSVVFTATVTGSAPTGSVGFTADGTTISGCSAIAFSGGTVNAPTATCSTSSLSQGVHSIVGTYSGDSGNSGSASSALSQVVNTTSQINVALASNGGIASASSTYGAGYAASGAIDNVRSGANWGNGGGWADGSPNSFPDWMQINFNGAKIIDHVVVYSVQDNYQNPIEPTDAMTFSLYGLVDFTVQGWDGDNWVTLGTVSSNNLVKRTINFSPYTTDRIRINITNALNTWSRITEVEALGN